MTEPTARVYDLDGTLVRLAVDWEAATADTRTVYREVGIDAEAGLWTLLERAPDHGLADAVEEALSAHERSGARRSVRLPVADDLVTSEVPAAVCSLNCEAACRIALEVHELDGHVDAVVGRDTIPQRKPNPAPLLAAVRALGAEPSEAVFIGDTERDAVTAERAGVRFTDAYEGRSGQ